MIVQDDILQLTIAAKHAGFNINENDLTLLPWEMGIVNHIPVGLPLDNSAVYIFKDSERYLKVGKVGPNANPRYQYQHYNPNSAVSNLARSLLAHPQYREAIGATCIKDWMINNTARYNILIPNHIHPRYELFVNFAEAFFILKCQPLFEG